MAVLELKGQALIFMILLTSGMDFLLFGYDQGLFGGILGGEFFQDMLGHPNATMSGLVTAIYDIGCAVGAVVAFVFGEKIGRKNSILLANVIVVIGAAIQTASYSYWQMFVARIVGTLIHFRNYADRFRSPESVSASARWRSPSCSRRPSQPTTVVHSSLSNRHLSSSGLPLLPGSVLRRFIPITHSSGASRSPARYCSACSPLSPVCSSLRPLGG